MAAVVKKKMNTRDKRSRYVEKFYASAFFSAIKIKSGLSEACLPWCRNFQSSGNYLGNNVINQYPLEIHYAHPHPCCR